MRQLFSIPPIHIMGVWLRGMRDSVLRSYCRWGDYVWGLVYTGLCFLYTITLIKPSNSKWTPPCPTNKPNTHKPNKHTNKSHTHTPCRSALAAASEAKVMMNSQYQWMPSFSHVISTMAGQMGVGYCSAAPFKACAKSCPQIPLFSISLCYIYYLHLDGILENNRLFFPMRTWRGRIALTLNPVDSGIRRSADSFSSPLMTAFLPPPAVLVFLTDRCLFFHTRAKSVCLFL